MLVSRRCLVNGHLRAAQRTDPHSELVFTELSPKGIYTSGSIFAGYSLISSISSRISCSRLRLCVAGLTDRLTR